MKRILLPIIAIAANILLAQPDSANPPFTVSGYLEAYYAYDFGNPSDHARPGFVYSFNRHNEVNLNLGFLKASYDKKDVRANLALMTGTYANANLAAEPGVLKNIYEANAGVKISKNKALWLDAGIFASHIGFESAIGKDCWNLTRSVLADNSPYYESGAKISYTSDDGKWFLSGILLNGWQRIKRVDGNNTPAFGHQLTYKPNAGITLNSSSFIGSDVPDSVRQMRYFHNLFGQFQLNEKLGLIAGFDLGMQQKSKGSAEYFTWYAPVLIARYAPGEKISIAARAEYYSDENQVIVATGTVNGFKTLGYSLNLDYQIAGSALLRLEGRALTSRDKIFILNNKPDNRNYFFTASLAVSF